MKPCAKCDAKPWHGLLYWGGLIAVGTALEAMALRNKAHNHTFSHATRYTFRVEHPAGKAAFVVGCTALYSWYVKHILTLPADGKSSS